MCMSAKGNVNGKSADLEQGKWKNLEQLDLGESEQWGDNAASDPRQGKVLPVWHERARQRHN